MMDESRSKSGILQPLFSAINCLMARLSMIYLSLSNIVFRHDGLNN